MIDLNKVLKKMGDKTEKSWTYLKGLFNGAFSEYGAKFGDALEADVMMTMALVKVGKKYDLTKEDVESMIELLPEVSDEDKQIAKDIESMFDEDDDGLVITDDVNFGNPNSWDRFLKSIPDPTVARKDFKKTPSLLIMIGATYYLKMTSLDPPYTHEFEGTYGKYNKHAFKVTLVKISDEDLYGEKYEFGDLKGKLAYKDGKDYTLWLDDKAAGYFNLFWASLTDNELPDKRIFTYKFSKKGKYNVYTFKEAKT